LLLSGMKTAAHDMERQGLPAHRRIEHPTYQ
jgi:hypothetical protein